MCQARPCRRRTSRMWWPGLPRNGQKAPDSRIQQSGPQWQDANELDRTTSAARDLHQARSPAQRRRRSDAGRSHPPLRPFSPDSQPQARLPGMGFARLRRAVPCRPDPICDVSKPGGDALRRRYREDCLLGAEHRRRTVPGLCDQLRTPRLPGPLVRAIEFVHVPLSRWRLLRGRVARLGPAGARALRVPLQDRWGRSVHRNRRHAYARTPRSSGEPHPEEAPVRLIGKVGRWFDDRLQLGKPIMATMAHPVPRRTASWFYVFGSAALTVFGLQVVTGILLAILYVPSAGEAWNALLVLNHQVSAGWFIRALHGWGSNFMLAIVLIHMVQVFLFGAYKFPRELTWIVGVLLLLMTLGMAFTGQVLRFDQDAYWGLGIGASITSRIPFVGGSLVHLLLGGPIIAGATLSRFFALHVFVIPGSLLLFAALHVWMVLKLGINEWPMPGRAVRRSNYLQEYKKLTHEDGVPFVPAALWKDAIFSAAVLAAVVVCAVVFGPFGPSGQPDPTIIHTVPKPDFFFLWMYAALAYLPPAMETPFILIVPMLGIAILVGLPFYAAEGEKSWHRRPIAVLMLCAVAISWGALTHRGTS